MSTQENLLGQVGALADQRHTEVMASLGRIEAALGEQPVPPEPPEPGPTANCLSGVYTSDSDGDGSAETDFGNWRHRKVEKVLTFTPTDSWSNTWWVGQFGGDYPYLDRLIITIGLCLKGQNVDSSVTGTPWKDWATAVKKAGIIKPIFRLGHEANGNWYDWKITGHENTWYKRYQTAADQCKQAFPESTVQMCLASGQRVTGFTYPDKKYVDSYGVDLYDAGNGPSTWADHVKIAKDYGVPLHVPEWGLWATPDGRGDNPAFIDKMADNFAKDCAGGSECYFNKDSSSAHKLSHYPNSEARYLVRFGG